MRRQMLTLWVGMSYTHLLRFCEQPRIQKRMEGLIQAFG